MRKRCLHLLVLQLHVLPLELQQRDLAFVRGCQQIAVRGKAGYVAEHTVMSVLIQSLHHVVLVAPLLLGICLNILLLLLLT